MSSPFLLFTTAAFLDRLNQMNINVKDSFFVPDRENLFDVLVNSFAQIDSAWSFPPDISAINKMVIKNVVIAGLGGSAIAGDILKNYLRNERSPLITVSRGYTVPDICGPDTLVIACSYSGNTEETLSAYNDSLAKKAQVIAVTTGGDLARLAESGGAGVVYVDKGYQPRFALYSMFFSLLKILDELELIPGQEVSVKAVSDNIRSLSDMFSVKDGPAYNMARSIQGFTPVIYSVSGLNECAGRRFKAQLNENSKIHAWCGEYPEMNHNEIVGWERVKSGPVKYKVINITDSDIDFRISRRIDIINDLIGKEGIDIINIQGSSKSFKLRLLEVIYLCDWVSYYLGLFNGEDPGEIDFIHHLKKKISEELI